MKEEPEEVDNTELLGVIQALLDILDDKDQDVRQSVIESIERISEKHPDAVIRTAVYFCELHRKVSTVHKMSLLSIMSSTCKYAATSLNADLASSIAELAVSDLLGEAENEAAELLIVLSKTHCVQAMGGLLNKLDPGVLPHHIIVFTIGKLAVANPHGMLSFIKLTLTIILPMLHQIREETLKQAICFTTGKFCDAINDYIMNADKTAPEINKDKYKEEICSVVDFLTHNWLRTSRDFKSTEAILTALIPMIPLLPQELDSERIVKLIPICLNLCRKQEVRLAAVKLLAVVLSCATADDKEVLRPYAEQIHQTLFGFISVLPFEASRDALLTHYEILQCSRSLVILYPEESLDRILQQLRSSNANQRARALLILKHLINTLPPEDDGSLHRIALSLQESLGENGALQMVLAIVALMARPMSSLLPSQKAIFVRYMVQFCDLNNAHDRSRKVISQFLLKKVSHCGTKSDDTEAHTGALYLLATTVDGAESWLWPCLIEALLDSTHVASVTSVLRALAPLATKIICNDNSSITKRDFPGTKVLSRCLELLNNPANRLAVVTFLKAAAPLLGHRVKPYWDVKLLEFSQFLQNDCPNDLTQQNLSWEEKIVEWLEESVKLEGKSWGAKLADELALKSSAPGIAPLLALVCNSNAHINLLIELARSHGTNKEFARAVGICAKRHLDTVLKVMEEFCATEDNRKEPVKILGFMKDFVKDFAKTATVTETAKVGLLHSYAEIAQRGDPQKFFPSYEKHVLPWTIKHLNLSKELSIREAGLSVLEQVSKAVHLTRWPESQGLHVKGTALAILISMLQSPSGYRPLQLYLLILRTAIALIRTPPILNIEEHEILLSGMLDKTIGATTEIILLLNSEVLYEIIDELGTLANEIIFDSANMLAELIEILLPWMQSKSSIEKKTTLLVLRRVLRSYEGTIKYTYPSGKFDAGKLVGRSLSWCGIVESSLKPLAIDCTVHSLNIARRHRSMSHVTIENVIELYEHVTSGCVQRLSLASNELGILASREIPDGDIVGLAEGLIEGLLFREEGGLVAAIALAQLFKIKGSMMSRNEVDLVDSIITQMRHMENANCRDAAAVAVALLMMHHPEEVIERLLHQPLPLDQSTESCWKEIGSNDVGHRALELLLIKLETNNPFTETSASTGKNTVASFSSLTAIIALRHLLQSSNNEDLISEEWLPRLLSIFLKYLACWLHIDAPATLVNTKYGYVPNREASKINPHVEVYSVLTNVLSILEPNTASSLLNETIFLSKTEAEGSVISTVRTLIACAHNKSDRILQNMVQSIGKLFTSAIAIQRAVAAAFYAELIGKVDCKVITIDAIISNLYEARSDSSSLVRTLATSGLSRIAYLDRKLIDVYLDSCIDALLEGLEEPTSKEEGSDVVLASLCGLSKLLSVQLDTISPRVMMAIKPFVEKENLNMKLAAMEVLEALVHNWMVKKMLMNEDLTDRLFWFLPCLIIRLEDPDAMVAKTAQNILLKIANILQSKKLYDLTQCIVLEPQQTLHFEASLKDLIDCLKEEFSQRVEEVRNAVTHGYSRSENFHTRATSALILGLIGSLKPEDIQRLLQLLRNRENIVRIRASRALSYCFSF